MKVLGPLGLAWVPLGPLGSHLAGTLIVCVRPRALAPGPNWDVGKFELGFRKLCRRRTHGISFRVPPARRPPWALAFGPGPWPLGALALGGPRALAALALGPPKALAQLVLQTCGAMYYF